MVQLAIRLQLIPVHVDILINQLLLIIGKPFKQTLVQKPVLVVAQNAEQPKQLMILHLTTSKQVEHQVGMVAIHTIHVEIVAVQKNKAYRNPRM